MPTQPTYGASLWPQRQVPTREEVKKADVRHERRPCPPETRGPGLVLPSGFCPPPKVERGLFPVCVPPRSPPGPSPAGDSELFFISPQSSAERQQPPPPQRCSPDPTQAPQAPFASPSSASASAPQCPPGHLRLDPGAWPERESPHPEASCHLPPTSLPSTSAVWRPASPPAF